MSRYDKIRSDILSGKCDKNISETDMRFFLDKIGAVNRRTNGSHIQYTIDNIPELINIQPKNGKIKPYQVKEIRNIVKKYRLGEAIW
ncbi:MAG: type II toxin-antitoxin system HicA family toxin [Lachnospiraceae bacterium]|nr:type II toxin-antitoxin system HicA family toxin [Lachnospiraceae bacterium]